MKKYLKWMLTLSLVLALSLSLLLAGCNEQPEIPTTTAPATGATEPAAQETVELYWNVDGADYRGDPSTAAVRRKGDDGLYSITFAAGGKQEKLKVTEEALNKGIDMLEIMHLVLDENGVAVDVKTVEEATGGYVVRGFFVEEIDGNTYICNSAPMYDGYQKSFAVTDKTQIYLAGAASPLIGMKTEIKMDDEVTAVCGADGVVTHVFVEPLGEIPDVYWNVTRLYDSTAGATTRKAESDGTYVFEMALNGQPVTVKAKNKEAANAMDSIAARNMVLTFDSNGYVIDAVNGEAVVGGYFSSWCRVIEETETSITTRRVRSGSNQGTVYTGLKARNFVAYDVSGQGAVMGEVTQLRYGDEVHCLTNSRGQVCIAFIVDRLVEDAKVYWNVEREYDSTNNVSTRQPDGNGWYTFLLACEGEQVTVKTKDASIVQKMDAKADRHFGLKVDKDGVIEAYYTADSVTGGTYFASWCDVIEIGGDGTVKAERTIGGSNQGTIYSAKMAEDCVVYDVSGVGSFVGQITELQVGDRIQGQTNSDGELVFIHVVSRLADSEMYWNVERKWDSTNKTTTRQPDADGYYHILVTYNGKQAVYKTKDKSIVNTIDGRADRHFGLKLSGDVITKVYTPAQVTGGTYFASWCDVTSLKGGKVTALRTIESSNYGTSYTAPIAENCKIFDVTSYAEPVGKYTTLRIGDEIHGEMNAAGELVYIYVVGKRTAEGKVYWNVERQYDSVNKVSLRQPDGEGWYEFLLACEGGQVTVKTQDPEIVNKMDAKADRYFGLKVSDEGVIEKYYSADAVTGGSWWASWCDVTAIDGSQVTTERILDGSNKGTVYTADMASDCKVYNVSSNYMKFAGEETELRVGDRIQGQKDASGKLVIIFVVERPDIPGEPDHFHCLCGTGAHNGVGSHTCDGTTGWSAWTNPRRLPTSGSWYLTVDVTTEICTTVPVGGTLNLCLNGHTITGPETAGVFGNHGTLTITDCRETAGSVLARCDQWGAVIYQYEGGGASTTNIFAGSLTNTLGSQTKDGSCVYVGNKGANPAVFNLYGGTLTGTAVTSGRGGTVKVIHGNTFNMYGGKVCGGTAPVGGNFDIDNGTLNLYGGEITGGTVAGSGDNEGGNIRVGTAGTLNVYGGKITDGGVAADGTVTTKKGGNIQTFGIVNVYGGEVTGGKASNVGGNINTWGSKSQVNISGGLISGGEAVNGGDNISIENLASGTPSVFTMSGGSVTDGDIRVAYGTATVTGGTVDSGLSVQGASTLTISGDPVISGSRDYNLKITKAGAVTMGDFTDGARIGITSTVLGTPIGTLADAADKAFFESDNQDYTVQLTAENGLYLRSAHSHCLCGGTVIQDHACDDDIGWVKWTDPKSLPVESGYYYLAADVDLSDMDTHMDLARGVRLSLCLNGHTITGSESTTMWWVREYLSISDCQMNEDGTYKGNVIAQSNVQGTMLHVFSSAADSSGLAGTFELYGGNLKATGKSEKSGGILFIGNSGANTCVFNMYGGTISGGRAAEDAGAIYINTAGAVFNMYGGKICGCSADRYGGAVYAASGRQFNMYGGEISGNTAKSGGNVFTGGVFNLYDGTVTGGLTTASGEGGNVTINTSGILNQYGGTISDGGFSGDTVLANKGGNLMVFGKFNQYGGTVSGGKAISNGGNIATWGGSILLKKTDAGTGDPTVSGGLAQYGGSIHLGGTTAGTLEIHDGAIITGGKTTASGEGGNINVGTIHAIDMYGGTIEKGEASGQGGNVFLYGKLNMYGGTISGGKAGQGGNVSGWNNYTITMAKSDKSTTVPAITGGAADHGGNVILRAKDNTYHPTLDMSCGEITGGQTTNNTGRGGGVYAICGTVKLSGDVKISGNTGTNLYLYTGMKVTSGELAETAAVGMSMYTPGEFTTVSDLAMRTCFTPDSDDHSITYTNEGVLSLVSGHAHCVCGDGSKAGVGEHICDGTVVWTKWESTNSLPTSSGHYYLADDVTLTAAWGLDGATVGDDISICLNGNTIYGASDKCVIYVQTGVTITDCSAKDKQGAVVSRANAHGSVAYMNDKNGSSVLNLYAGTFKTEAELSKIGGILFLGMDGSNTCTFNMYGGTIQGAQNTKNGANIYACHKPVINLYGGLVTGGNTTANGGNIYIESGTLNLYKGATVSNGSANYGGNIYMTGSAVANMHDGAVVTGGITTNEAGNIQVGGSCTFNMYGGEVSNGGVNASGATVTTYGGNFFLYGKLNMYGGTISGGKAKTEGGNIAGWSSFTITMAKSDKSTTVPTISGGTAKNGGNIVLRGTAPKLDMSYGIITGGTASGLGGGISGQEGSIVLSGTAQITGNNGSDIYLDGTAMTAGTLEDGASFGIAMAAPGTFLTNVSDLTAFFTATDTAYEDVYEGGNMVLKKK